MQAGALVKFWIERGLFFLCRLFFDVSSMKRTPASGGLNKIIQDDLLYLFCERRLRYQSLYNL